MVEAARVAERGRERPRDGDRPRPAARPGRPPSARAARRPSGDRSCSRSGDDKLRFAAVAGDRGELTGATITRSTSKSGRVLERRQSERVDSVLDDPEVDHEADAPDRSQHRSLGAAASSGDGRSACSLLTTSSEPTSASPTTDLRLAETFAARAALAVDLSERIARDSLRRVVEGQELERRRLARGASRRDRAGADVDPARAQGPGGEVGRSPPRVPRRRNCASSSSRRCRTSAGSPSSCARARSTTSAWSRPSSGSPRRSPSRRGSRSTSRRRSRTSGFAEEVETALYRIVQESLTNVVKHAQARRVSILLARKDGAVNGGGGGRRTGLRPGRADRRRLRAHGHA